MTPNVPRDLPDFTVGRLLHAGRTVQVHQAVHRPSGAAVAIKIWNATSAELPAAVRDRVAVECSVYSRLPSSATAPATTSSETTAATTSSATSQAPAGIVGYVRAEAPADGRPWIAMDLYERSLADRIVDGPLTLPELFALADDLLAGLEAIHRLGYVHRDVTPANVLLRGHRAALTDFGLATELGSRVSDPFSGTWGFIAPEVAQGRDADFRSDLYAAARTLAAATPPTAPGRWHELLRRAASPARTDRPADAPTFRRLIAATRDATLATTTPSTAAVPEAAAADDPGRVGRWLRPWTVTAWPPRPRAAISVVTTALVAGAAVVITLTGVAAPLVESDELPLTIADGPPTTPAPAGPTPFTPFTGAPAPTLAPVPTVRPSTLSAQLWPTSAPARIPDPVTAPSTGTRRPDRPAASTTRPATRSLPRPTRTSPPPKRPASSTPVPTRSGPGFWVGADCPLPDPAHLQVITQAGGADRTSIRLEAVSVSGSSAGGPVRLDLTGHLVGPVPTAGQLWFVARPDPATRGRDGNPGDGRVHPIAPVHPDARGCARLTDVPLSPDDATVGLTYRFWLVHVPASSVAGTADGAGWGELPVAVRALSWFDLDTTGLTGS